MYDPEHAITLIVIVFSTRVDVEEGVSIDGEVESGVIVEVGYFGRGTA